jgi:hypothetical protein
VGVQDSQGCQTSDPRRRSLTAPSRAPLHTLARDGMHPGEVMLARVIAADK